MREQVNMKKQKCDRDRYLNETPNINENLNKNKSTNKMIQSKYKGEAHINKG